MASKKSDINDIAAIRPRPEKSTRAAGLYYVNDSQPGIRRKRCGRGFSYIDEKGRLIRDPEERSRLEGLAIPPAWTEVWICSRPDGHLQATGRDDKGRKQYKYHPRWRKHRSRNKYNRMVLFGKALPRIREQVQEDLSRPGLPRQKVLATVVTLLETTLVRIGNSRYASQNKSYGLTTMRDRHADVYGSKLKFHFRGKRGKKHTVTIKDRRLARIVKQCRDIPGYELFQYFDENGQRHTIDSSDVNAYLQKITEQAFTAKDFRTWGGSILTMEALDEIGRFETQEEAKKNVREAVKEAARQLGNRVETCRTYYIHPAIAEAYMEGSLLLTLEKHQINQNEEENPSPHALNPIEAALITVLTQSAGAEDS